MTPEHVVQRLQGAKLLTVQDFEKINPLDHEGWKEVNAPLDEYDREYPDRLREYLGLELEIADADELNHETQQVAEEAETLADTWIAEAKEVRRGVKKDDVIRAARLYYALDALIKKYDAVAVTMASWHMLGYENDDPSTDVMPPLAWMELSKQNIPCCCESMIDCLATQLIGQYLSDGHAGFAGDPLERWADWDARLKTDDPGDVVIIGHCGAPITPHGDDRIPYTIRDHVVSGEVRTERISHNWRQYATLCEPDATITATTVDWPSDEPGTIAKFDVYEKRLFFCTGTILDGEALYEDFADTVCRNKIVVGMDAAEEYQLFHEVFRKQYGGHAVVFYGDLSEQLRDFADLTGFEVTR